LLWALTAYPLQLYIKGNSIVYLNQATNNTAVAVLYVIATCGSLFFSKVRAMIIFGALLEEQWRPAVPLCVGGSVLADKHSICPRPDRL
jgi:hypothetical protein